jgi:cytochrome c oxidase subunit II
MFGFPENISTFGGRIDSLFYAMLAVTAVLFAAVQGALVWFVFRYRASNHTKGFYIRGNAKVETVWTLIPVLILAVMGFASQKLWSEIKSQTADPAGTVLIRIQAEQFAWNIQYPGADGQFETADDIRNLNQLHIPANRKVRITLTSVEKPGKPAVIHSFFLPEFRLKQDVVPGMATDVRLEARKTGQYEIACAEFCGLGHYRMKGFLTVHKPDDFDAWLRAQPAGAAA